MHQEKRSETRFEPQRVRGFFQTSEGDEIRGLILDASRGGFALDVSEVSLLPEEKTTGTLKVATGEFEKDPRWLVGSATVVRRWPGSKIFDKGGGMALQLNNGLSDSKAERLLLSGIRQQSRLVRQEKLAVHDMETLSADRRSIRDCQIKLFIVTLTLGVTLGAAYLTLAYHGVAVGTFSEPQLSFWRTMMAALPGLLSITCALMAAQQSQSIQRIDAYLSLLKGYSVTGDYPREYRGWETVYRKLRHILGTEKCESCGIAESSERKCGQLRTGGKDELDSKSMWRDPPIDLYNVVMFGAYFFALCLSLAAVLIELKRFNWAVNIYMGIGSLMTILMVVATVGLFLVFRALRKGKFSFDSYKRCWKDLLAKCSYRI
jgi:hypothetical protein